MRFWLVAVVLLITTDVDLRGQTSSSEKTTIGKQKKLEIADQLHGATLPSETDAALQHFRSAAKNQSKVFLEELNLATKDVESRRYSVALRRFKKLVELNPELAQLWQQMGRLQYELKEFDGAANSFSRASQISPESAVARNNLGFSYLNLNRLEEAESSFIEALRLEPELKESVNGLCIAYELRDKHDLAIQYCRSACVLDPTASVPNYMLGNVYYSLGYVDQALPYFIRARALEPEADLYHIAVGYSQLKLKRLQDALTSLHRAVELKPSNQAFVGIGLIYYAIGMRDAARHAFERAIEVNPVSPYAHLNLGLACVNTGERDCALKQYNVLQSLAPSLASTLFKRMFSDKVIDAKALRK